MKKQGYLSVIGQPLKATALTDLGIFTIVGLICWFSGWRTTYPYGLMWAGIMAILLGVLRVLGSYETWSFAYQYALSAGTKNVHE